MSSNDQRKVIYQQRNELLEATDISETIQLDARRHDRRAGVAHIAPESVEEQWDIAGLEKTLAAELGLEVQIGRWLEEEKQIDEKVLRARSSKPPIAAMRRNSPSWKARRYVITNER